MLIFVTGLLLCMKWLFSLLIRWLLMILPFCLRHITKYLLSKSCRICGRVLLTNDTETSCRDLNVFSWISTAKLFLLSNVICYICQSLENIIAWCICFEWFGNVSLNWTEVSAEHTVDCRVPDLQHCHVELSSPTPSKKEPKMCAIGKDTRLLRFKKKKKKNAWKDN